MPYSSYDHFEFDVPLGTKGDNYDRFLVRFEEMKQSMRICEQAIANRLFQSGRAIGAKLAIPGQRILDLRASASGEGLESGSGRNPSLPTDSWKGTGRLPNARVNR